MNTKKAGGTATAKALFSLLKRLPWALVVFNRVTVPVLWILAVTFYLKGISLWYLLAYVFALYLTYAAAGILEKRSSESGKLSKSKSGGPDSPPFPHLVFFGKIIFFGTFVAFASYSALIRYGLRSEATIAVPLVTILFSITYAEIQFWWLRRNFAIFSKRMTLPVIRTVSLLLAGIAIMIGFDFIKNDGLLNGKMPFPSKSEITWTLSTIGQWNEDDIVNAPAFVAPKKLPIPNRDLKTGDAWQDVAELQRYLKSVGKYAWEINGTYDEQTASSLNEFIRIQKGEIFEKNEFGPLKQSVLREIVQMNETTGSLSTSLPPWVRIDSIQSVDGKANATLDQNGNLTVMVLPKEPVWMLSTSIDPIGKSGSLFWIVIGPPSSSIPPGKYDSRQNVILKAAGASAIYFTVDDSEPNCSGRGFANIASIEKAIRIKAISCYGKDGKITGQTSIFEFEVR
jgi:hypothetical protein